ncbi:MAG TPA: HAD family hydrolase [Candidatus Woesebacteria bacterium]|nr:HAD family hydrolase [Candidatus Woesebacteria bacterium]
MDNEKGIGNQETGVEEVVDVSMKEVGKILLAQTPGLVVIDNDFSLKTKEYELGLGGKEPGRIPEESAELLRKLRQSGWQVLVVSNQPKEGHQVARLIKKMKGAEYPIFPDTVKEIIGDGNVHGGGKDFLWNKYKDSRKAVEKTADWLVDHAQYVLGQVYFVGDRQSDVEFGRRVDKELKEKGFRRQVNTWKVKGLELPKPLKPLEKYIP